MDVSQVKYFSNRLNGWERSLVFDDFSELAIVTFDGVGGVNHPANFAWKVKECGEFFPIFFPGADSAGILTAP